MESDRYLKQTAVVYRVTVVILCLLCVRYTDAQYAKSTYYLDATSDCYISGYLLIRTDGVVNVFSRKPGSPNSDILMCTLRFKPDDDREIIDVAFTHMTLSDKGVTLRVDVPGAGSYTLRAGASKPQKLTATGAQVTISLSRLSLEDRDYSFGIIIRVYKEDKTVVDRDEKPVGVGLVVGIVAGVIIFIVFVAVLIVCCYRRKREQYRSRGPDHPKADLAPSTLTPAHSFGIDNAARNGSYPPAEKDSPLMKKKPLTLQIKPPDYEDLSDSGSDSRQDRYERKSNGGPFRPGAVRYENERNRSYSERQNRPYNERNRPYNEDRNRPYNEERNRPYNEERNRPYNEDRNRPYNEERNRPYNEERNRPYNEQPVRRPDNADRDRRQENGPQQKPVGPPPKSPILTALQNHPRFRASFRAAEQESEERTRGISGKVDDNAYDSDASMTETWNTTFDTNFDDDPRPPAGSFVPTLPPVPMSPREPVRRENLASIHRAPRPSSSSSEMEHLQGEGGMDRGVSMNPEGPPSPSEIVAIRVQDPHSPSIKRKANAQRAPQPDPAQDGTSIPEPHASSADSQNSEPPPPSKLRSKKSTPNKPKPKPDKPKPDKPKPDTVKPTEKKPKSKKPVEPVNKEDQARGRSQDVKNKPREDETEHEGRFKKSDSVRKSNRSREGKSKPKEEGTEYEGRFKKSDSVRKSKSRSPRIGRSRSTGTGLEDTDSIGRPTTPRGYRAVPSVTADDYEDSDVDSNYNPLRRTGSKNSLYASRSSLYARRRRKNSLGESVYSLAFDDLDSERPKRDSFKERSLSRRDRNYRSLGDLEIELQDQETRSTQTLRECATQTGTGFANVSPGKKMVTKRTKPRSVSSSQTQTAKSKPRNLDSSSSSSGVTRPRQRKNSASSTSARSKSRDRASSASSLNVKGKPRKNESGGKSEEEEADRRRRPETREKPKPKTKPRRGPGSKGRDSEDDDDDLESIRTGMTGPLDHSSLAGGPQVGGIPPGHQVMYAPHNYPSYPAGYPAHMAYMQATGQPPMVMPYPQPGGGVPLPTGGAAQPNPVQAAVSGPTVTASATTPRPPQSKWDMLCRMTDAGDSTKDWNDSASVAGSMFSNPYYNTGHQVHPGYSSAVSDYAASEVSGPARSVTGRSQASRKGGRSAWDMLREMTDQESQYAPSESNV